MPHRHGHNDYDRQRWLAWRNDSGETCPAYGLIEVTGAVNTKAGLYALTGTKPTATGKVFAVNGPVGITAGKFGECLMEWPSIVQYAGSTPTFGDIYGPKAGQWTLDSGQSGFEFLGGALTNPGRALWRHEVATGAVLFDLDEDMGNMTADQADATVDAVLHSTGVSVAASDTIVVHDDLAGGTDGSQTGPYSHAKSGQKGMAVWDTENCIWVVVWIQAKARWIEFTLTADMSSGSAAATINDWWGAPEFGLLASGSTTVYDNQDLFDSMKNGDKGIAVYDEQEDQYVVIAAARVSSSMIDADDCWLGVNSDDELVHLEPHDNTDAADCTNYYSAHCSCGVAWDAAGHIMGCWDGNALWLTNFGFAEPGGTSPPTGSVRTH